MWIRKKKLVELEKRVADLEVQVQSQQRPQFKSELTSDGKLVRCDGNSILCQIREHSRGLQK